MGGGCCCCWGGLGDPVRGEGWGVALAIQSTGDHGQLGSSFGPPVEEERGQGWGYGLCTGCPKQNSPWREGMSSLRFSTLPTLGWFC